MTRELFGPVYHEVFSPALLGLEEQAEQRQVECWELTGYSYEIGPEILIELDFGKDCNAERFFVPAIRPSDSR